MIEKHHCHECGECRVKPNLYSTTEKDAVLVYCHAGEWKGQDRLFINVRQAVRFCGAFRQAEDDSWQGEW